VGDGPCDACGRDEEEHDGPDSVVGDLCAGYTPYDPRHADLNARRAAVRALEEWAAGVPTEELMALADRLLGPGRDRG